MSDAPMNEDATRHEDDAQATREETPLDSPSSLADVPPSGAEAIGEAAATVVLSQSEHEELTRKAEERDLYLGELQRLKAEFENYQKRVRRERPGWEVQAARRLVLDVLPLVDNFERALETSEGARAESVLAGVRMIHQMLQGILESHEVAEIDALGKPFDPQFHEAIAQIEVDEPEKDGAVVDVQLKGYSHKGAVIRASRVVVGKARS